MGVCLIKKSGGAPDTRGITAIESDVLVGRTFLKADGNVGTGSMTDRGSPTYNLPINGSLVLPEGSYSGGVVQQNVPVFPGQTVYSGKNQVVVDTSGKYASGNIYIPQIKNLTPEVIKKGMYVAGVGPGTFEGYVNDDPDMPFFYGTFGPGFEMGQLIFYRGSTKGTIIKGKDRISLQVPASNPVQTAAIVFSKALDLNLYRTISWLANFSGASNYTYFSYVIARNYIESWIRTSPSQGNSYNPDLGEILKSGTVTYTPGTEEVIDVSGLSGAAYLYFGLRAATTSGYDGEIFYVKCNR